MANASVWTAATAERSVVSAAEGTDGRDILEPALDN